MQIVRPLIFLCVSAVFSFTAFAQTFHFKNYSVDDGLPFIQVVTVCQDKSGNLWTGGYGGLSKFDGKKFTNFSPKNGLSHHTVTNIVQDNAGDLWISTIDGLNRLSGKKFSVYRTENGLPSNSINDLLVDKHGVLWIATSAGLCTRDGDSFKIVAGFSSVRVTSLFEDSKGEVWVGSDRGIVQIVNGVLKEHAYLNYNSRLTANCFTESRSGEVWIATDVGLFVKSEDGFVRYTTDQGLPGNFIKTVSADAQGRIWVGTANGLFRYDESMNRFKEIVVARELNSKIIESLFSDYEGNFWIGTYNGLYKYKGERFLQYSAKEGLNNTFIFQILSDGAGDLFVGTSGGGFYLMHNGHFRNITKKDGLAGDVVNVAVNVEQGKMLIGTNEGLSIYNGTSFKNFSRKDGLQSDSVSAILENADGTYFLGGHNCISIFDGKAFNQVPIKTFSKNFDVWAIVRDKKGTVWAGTYLGGILRYNGKEFIECSSELGIKSPSTLNILVDGDYLIFGSLEGLYIYNGSSLVHVNETQGLNSDLIWFLYRNSKDKIWIGTNQGVNCFDWTRYKTNGAIVIKSYGKEEGFEGVECNSNAAYEDKTGNMWFGTVNGLIRYDQHYDVVNKLESKTSIVTIQVNDRDTILPQFASLPYNNNRIVFEFVGVCFSNPAKVKYQYMLQGSDKQWSSETKENVVTYSSLSPGSYVFKVKSCNNEGIWNATPVTYHFTIMPPFWATWWFRIISTLVVSFVIFLFFYYRIQQIRKEERERTELQKRIANVELMALRSQMNPHFIFNTMSSIQHFITQNATDDALKYLSKFAKLMRAIMENTKQTSISIKEEFDTLKLYLDLESMRFAGRFEYVITIDPAIDQNYDEIPSMIIQPYVENAILHGLLPKQGSGKLLISIEKKNNFIVCTIEDNGVGRVRSREINMNKMKRHRSMGMAITKERLAILSSVNKENFSEETTDLYDDSNNASGTRVVIHIPVDLN